MTPRARIRLSTRSIVVSVALVVMSGVVLKLASEATRVLGWVLVAVIVGGLLQPLVARLANHIPRPLALLAVVIGLLVPVGLLIYGSIDQIQGEARRLERVAPDAAAEIERSERFGEVASEFELTERVRDFVSEIPERLRGGDPAKAIRSAATRGVAFLATSVLSLFMILHGPRLAKGALAQIRDEETRETVTAVLRNGYSRACRYVLMMLVRVLAAGSFTFVVCELADIPGSLLMAVWVGTFALIPLFGVLTGGLAVILLSAAVDLDMTPWIAVVFVAYQVLDIFVMQRPLERRTVNVGPVATLVAAMIGFEAYGIGGMLVSIALIVLIAGVTAEVGPAEETHPALFGDPDERSETAVSAAG